MSFFKKNNKCYPITSFHDTNNVFEKIDLHETSKMPEEGWIQSCVHCSVYTSSTIPFTRSTYINKDCEFYFYLCNYCKKKIYKDVKEYVLFSKNCKKMIRKYKINHLKIDFKKGEIEDRTESPIATAIETSVDVDDIKYVYGQTDLEAELPVISIS